MTIVNEELAYKILDLLVKNGDRMNYTAILDALKPALGTDTRETLTDMIAHGLIKGNTKAGEYLKITIKGKTELQAHQKELAEKAEELRALEEQERKKIAEDKAEKCSDRWHQFFHDIFLLIIGALIAFFFDHISTIGDFFKSLFN